MTSHSYGYHWISLTIVQLTLMIFSLFSCSFAQAKVSDARPLPIGQKTEYLLKSGKPDLFAVELQQGQILRIDIQEKGINCKILVVKVSISGTQILAEADFGFGYDREVLTYIAEQTGSYIIAVGARQANQQGNYELTAQLKQTAAAFDHTQIKAENLLAEGLSLQAKGDLDGFLQAIEKLKESLALWRELKETYWEGRSGDLLGLIHSKFGEDKKALEYYSQALPLRKRAGDKSGEASTLNNIGAVYSKSGDSKEALKYYNQALALFKLTGDKSGEGTTLTNIGLIYSDFGEKQKALQHYEQALTLFRIAGDQIGEATTLTSTGLVYSDLGEKQKALNYYNQALPMFERFPDKSGIATVLTNIGSVYSDIGEKQKALEYFNRARPIFSAAGDKRGESTTLGNIGGVYLDFGEGKKALEYYNQALALDHLNEDKGGEAATLAGIGGVYANWGENQKALEQYNRALEFFRQVEDTSGEATSLNNLGQTHSDLGEKQKAFEYYRQALALFKKIENKGGEAITLNNFGLAYSSLGESRKALDYYNQAYALFKLIGDKSGEAAALTNLGLVYSDLGEKQKGLDYYNQALPLRKFVGDKSGEAETLTGIGLAYFELGESQKAIEYYNQASTTFKSIGDKRGEGTTLNNLGSVYSDTGEKQEALNYYERALLLFRLIEDKSREAATLSNLGLLYTDLGESQKALEYYNQALPLRKQVADIRGEGTTLSNMGLVYSNLRDSQRALDYYNRATSIFRRVDDINGEAATLSNIGGIYSNLGEKPKALEYYRMALPRLNLAGNKRAEAATLNNLMFDWNSLSNTKIAVFYGKRAISRYQELRTGLLKRDRETQKTYLKTVDFTYRTLAEILINQEHLAEALQVINFSRDQEFFDKNPDSKEEIQKTTFTGMEFEFNQKFDAAVENIGKAGQPLEEFRQKINNRQPTPEETAQLQELESKRNSALNDCVTLIKQMEVAFAKSVSNEIGGKTTDLDEMQAALFKLNEETKQNAVAVYTLTGEENFHILLITQKEIKHFSKPIKMKDLNEKAKEFAENIKIINNDTKKPKIDVTEQAKELYNIIFKPLEDDLPKSTTTIMWSLDGNLRYVPINALHDGKDYLIRRNLNNVVFTRSDTKRFLRPLNPIWKALVLANFGARKNVMNLGIGEDFPELVAGEAEITGILKKIGSNEGVIEGEPFLNDNFTKENMLTALKKKSPVVHISSHFSIKSGDLSRSFLVLGKGAGFSLFDMKKESEAFEEGKLFKDVDLLTLSACNTALDEMNADGREVDGFAELAQTLGAASVMATLWSVNECSTAEFMKFFYKNKINSKMTKAEALRQAQLDLFDGKVKLTGKETCNTKNDDKKTSTVSTRLQKKTYKAYTYNPSKPFEHPYYWSPFVLYGNWK